MVEESEKVYFHPISPLVLSNQKKRKVEAPSTNDQEGGSSAFRLVSVVNLKNKEGKEMFHSLDEILKEREENRKKRERTMRAMAGIPDPDQDKGNMNALSADDIELKKLEAMEASGKMMPTAAIERLHFLRRKKAGNSSETKKSSKGDMLWITKNQK